jgi:uncharacterized phage-like protein YoqJ
MKIAITGHRPKSLVWNTNYDPYDWNNPVAKAIRAWLSDQLDAVSLKSGGNLVAATGLALGCDQYFASLCIQKDIPFIAFCPCLDQDRFWPKSSKKIYNNFLSKAEEVKYTISTQYTGPECLLQRNIDMLDWLQWERGSVLLAIWNKQYSGGTYFTIEKAKERKIKTVCFNPREIGEQNA